MTNVRGNYEKLENHENSSVSRMWGLGKERPEPVRNECISRRVSQANQAMQCILDAAPIRCQRCC